MTTIEKQNIKKLDVGMLTALEMVLSERSITKAARQVGLSQPAMSNALSRMRQAFGDPLLVRGRHGLILTPRAEQILEQLQTVNARLETLGAVDRFEPKTSSTLFRIAATDYASFVLLPTVLKALRQAAPQVRVLTATVQNRQVEIDELETQRFDLRLGWLRSLPAHWYTKKLLKEDFVVIAARGNRRLKDGLTRKNFASFEHVALVTERPLYQSMLDRLLSERGMKRDVTAWVSNFSSIPFMVAHTDLIAVLPRRLALTFEKSAGCRIHSLPASVGDYDSSMAWHPRVHDDPAHRWLRKIIADSARAIK
jgi:DNA-binding transcriptional LysR family regulator